MVKKETRTEAQPGQAMTADQQVENRLIALREEYRKLHEKKIATERDRENLEERLKRAAPAGRAGIWHQRSRSIAPAPGAASPGERTHGCRLRTACAGASTSGLEEVESALKEGV